MHFYRCAIVLQVRPASVAGYTLCNFNNLLSSQQATLHDMTLINLVTTRSLLSVDCTMKMQTESKAATYVNWPQCAKIKHERHSYWLFCWWKWHQQSHCEMVIRSFLMCQNFITCLQDHDNGQPWICLTMLQKTIVWVPRLKISPHFWLSFVWDCWNPQSV